MGSQRVVDSRSNLVHAYLLGNKCNKHSSITAVIIKDVKCQFYFPKNFINQCRSTAFAEAGHRDLKTQLFCVVYPMA